MTDSALKSQLTDAMKAAMKAKEKEKLGAIRLMLSEIKRIEVDERIELDDSRILAILDKMLKQRRDSVQQYQAAQRQDLADNELFEIGIIESFLPSKLTDEEIDELIGSAIESTGASSMRDMGKVMGLIKPQIQGRADAAEVSKRIKSRLG
jgi:uncharacterized protein YqeY